MTQKILRTQLKELSVAEDGSSAISTISAIEDILQKYEAANGVMSIDLVENVAIEKLPDRIAMEIIKKKMESETWDIIATSTNSETKDQKCNSENATKSEATELPMKTADATNATTKAVKVKRKKSRERFPDVEAKLAEMMPEVKIKEPDGTIVRFKPKIAIRRDNLYKIITKIRLREDGMYDLETVLGSTVVDSKWVDNYYQTKRRLSSESSSSEETETPNDVISK
uniref:NET domain-containing protein n=1 Tax=Syphacia muris TaxID=451379 RepID=A0A0N5AWC0_9BILA